MEEELAAHPVPATRANNAAFVKTFVERYLDDVEKLAGRIQRFTRVQVDFQDMIADGREGLVNAARRFDPSLGFEGWTYAKVLVEGKIFDGIARHKGIPRRQYAVLRAEWMRTAETQVDAKPKSQSASQNAPRGQTVYEWILARTGAEAAYTIGSQSEPVETETPESRLVRCERERSLRSAMAVLPERDREVVELYFFADLALHEIAERLGLSTSTVHRTVKAAIGELGELLDGQ